MAKVTPPRPTVESVEEEEELTESDRREIDECMRIVRFSEEVIAGRHPRVKIPPHMRPAVSLSASTQEKNTMTNLLIGTPRSSSSTSHCHSNKERSASY